MTVALAISPIHGLVFHSAIIGGMDAERFSEFLVQARLNLDPNEQFVFIYDGAPAHRRPNQLGPNTEFKMLPPSSPFIYIVEQAISALKAAIKADISRPEVQERMNNRNEASDRGVALGVYRTQLLIEALEQNVTKITAGKCAKWYRFMQTYFPRRLNGEAIEG